MSFDMFIFDVFSS